MKADKLKKIKKQVLNYWFHRKSDYKKWFHEDPYTDRHIIRNFEEYVILAHNKKLEDLLDTNDGTLALIILLDQFPRNIYRNTFRAYSHDDKTVEIVKDKLNIHNNFFDFSFLNGLDNEMIMFFLMPLMHSESISDKNILDNLLIYLQNNSKNKDDDTFLMMKDYNRKHKEVLEKFGRYPKRNNSCGRKSTFKELKYIYKTKGRAF